MAEEKKAAEKPAPTVAAPAEAFDTTTATAVDPRTGGKFKDEVSKNGGRSGFEVLEPNSVGAVPGVDPKHIPAEALPGVTPDAHGKSLLAAAQAAAPSLTQEFVDRYELSDEVLAGIARREVPPPPTVGPIRSSDLYLTPGGWQNVPPGLDPSEVGKNSVSR